MAAAPTRLWQIGMLWNTLRGSTRAEKASTQQKSGQTWPLRGRHGGLNSRLGSPTLGKNSLVPTEIVSDMFIEQH